MVCKMDKNTRILKRCSLARKNKRKQHQRQLGVLVPRNFFRLMNLKSILDSDSYSFSSMWGIRLVAAATDEPLLCMSVGNLSRQNG